MVCEVTTHIKSNGFAVRDAALEWTPELAEWAWNAVRSVLASEYERHRASATRDMERQVIGAMSPQARFDPRSNACRSPVRVLAGAAMHAAGLHALLTGTANYHDGRPMRECSARMFGACLSALEKGRVS